MFLATDNIYEVLLTFWTWAFPSTIITTYENIFILLTMILTFIVVFIFGWQFHKSAFKGLKRFNFNMDSLISLGTFSAYLYSLWAMFNSGHIYFESAATITSLILLGRFFELKTKNRASQAMEKLM
jgi:cation transport ATPase